MALQLEGEDPLKLRECSSWLQFGGAERCSPSEDHKSALASMNQKLLWPLALRPDIRKSPASWPESAGHSPPIWRYKVGVGVMCFLVSFLG